MVMNSINGAIKKLCFPINIVVSIIIGTMSKIVNLIIDQITSELD